MIGGPPYRRQHRSRNQRDEKLARAVENKAFRNCIMLPTSVKIDPDLHPNESHISEEHKMLGNWATILPMIDVCRDEYGDGGFCGLIKGGSSYANSPAGSPSLCWSLRY